LDLLYTVEAGGCYESLSVLNVIETIEREVVLAKY